MSGFVWIDRDGQRHELVSPARIEAEAAEIAQEMDQYVAMLGNPDRMIRDPARGALRRLQFRLERLRAALARWNDHAIAATRAEAAALAVQIDRLPAMIAQVALVVALHDEHDRMIELTADAPSARTNVLAGPATDLQKRAIEACEIRRAPTAPTWEEAKAWLDDQPRFARPGQVDGGWFAWTDRKGRAHRLTDPLIIEREVVVVARELRELRSTLIAATPADALYTATNAAGASWERLQILRGDLERFALEETAREDAAWTAYAADWRAKRTKS